MENNSIKKKVDEGWKEKSPIEPPGSEEKAPSEQIEADFRFFLTTLGMQAWIALGVLPNPMTDKTEENLNQAKYIIDCLELLETKTKGNLDADEQELLENLLYELHLGFVNKTRKEGAV